ncbi:MAG: hypothetical protein U0641_12860 [Anaerolineae bacterium]
MNQTLLDSLTDSLLGMGLTEDDVAPLADLAECLVELGLDLDGAADSHGTHGKGREREEEG